MFGAILLYGGFLTFIAAFVISFLIIRGRSDLKLLHSRLLKAGFILSSLAFLLLIYYFISDDFTIYYVWLYSSRDMPLLYKIAAVLAGQQGTFLFWTWLSSMSILWPLPKKVEYRVLLISEAIISLLFLLTILTEPFKLMSQFEHLAGTAVTDGAGLDPELLSIWIGLHPPVTFLAFAAMTVPFAAATAYLFWRDEEWLADRRAQLSWLFFAVGVGITGGMWTYEAGWGLWTWDASMAGSLIPWLLLTAGLHRKNRPGQRAVLFMSGFIAILFASFIIRSGLWGSVHEFTETSINYVLVSAILLITAVMLWRIYRNRDILKPGVSVDSLAPGVMVFLGSIVFIGLSIPLFSRISGDEAAVGAEFYNLTCYPFALLLLILLGICLTGKNGKRIGIIAGMLSILLAFVRPGETYWLVNPASDFYQQASVFTRAYGSLSLLSMIPPVIFALWAVLPRFRRGGVPLIHLGTLLLFSGGIFASAFVSEYTLVFNVDDIGSARPAGDYEIRLSKFHVEQNQRGNWVQRATVEVLHDGDVLGSTTAVYIRDRSGNYASSGIIRRPEKDIFVTFPGLEPVADAQPQIPLHIKVYPLLNIFWLGQILLVLGIMEVIIRNGVDFDFARQSVLK